ncbi:hypothetical protein N9018_04690, partial [Rhodopirellula sp.]|nr:hypothetical protein [Rhodopirellula sp.]
SDGNSLTSHGIDWSPKLCKPLTFFASVGRFCPLGTSLLTRIAADGKILPPHEKMGTSPQNDVL